MKLLLALKCDYAVFSSDKDISFSVMLSSLLSFASRTVGDLTWFQHRLNRGYKEIRVYFDSKLLFNWLRTIVLILICVDGVRIF